MMNDRSHAGQCVLQSGCTTISLSKRRLADCGTSLPQQDAATAGCRKLRLFDRYSKWKKATESLFHGQFGAVGGLVVGLLVWGVPPVVAASPTVRIEQPLEWQVVQRYSAGAGTVDVHGSVLPAAEAASEVQVRFQQAGDDVVEWQSAEVHADGTFQIAVEVPAGGWYRCEVRAEKQGVLLAEAAVDQVGVGEVFVVAGQSNSANFGEERQRPETGMVSTRDGAGWRPADDPQPGAQGGGGSFLPPLGDGLVREFGVPVGFVACGIGATSVREWLPETVIFPEPPTRTGRVRQLPEGGWHSDGAAYAMLVARMKSVGPAGFRAVLWHQGESDANQPDASRTLPGERYREYLSLVIRATSHDLGRDVPWFVAQASYHVPGDESSPDIRAAQAAICRDGIALAGPDTDSLTGDQREAGGAGVHFSGPGLRAHAALWLDVLTPWLRLQASSAP